MPILLTAILSLIFLLALHEASHFAAAKAFGIRVDEFGIGYPPRLVSRKIGETVYSLNALPFGAFVDIPPHDLNKRSGWKRFWVLAAGVISFWIFTFILFSTVFYMGAPVQVEDSFKTDAAMVQILMVAPDSPAEEAGLQMGDVITQIKSKDSYLTGIEKVQEVQEITDQNRGQEIEIVVRRNKEAVSLRAVPRVTVSEKEGPLGIALARVVVKNWGLLEAVKMGARETIDLTLLSVKELARAIASLFTEVESRVQIMGPVGITGVFVQMGRLGTVYFLRTMALISLNLAILNALPVLPITDGARILLLGIEKVWKKPFNEETEQKINTVFFVLLIFLMFLVTIRDIKGLL